MSKVYISIFFFLFVTATISYGQTGSLRGGSAILTNGSKTITLKVPSSGLANYTLSLATAQSTATSTQWIKNDGSGNLSWDGSPGGLTGNGVAYVPGNPQATATSGHYLFYIQNLSSNSNVNSPGGFVTDAVVDGNNSSATGITINVTNTATSVGEVLTGVCVHAGSFAGTGGSTNTGISVDATGGTAGGGANYAALFNGGNVGLGAAAPSEQLEVTGNIRISGINGLKITEWTDPGGAAATAGTMGKVTLAAGTKVVKTSSVTVNSRIFLMSQNGAAGTVGTAYVSARTLNTSFTITSTSATDVSDVAWWIVEP